MVACNNKVAWTRLVIAIRTACSGSGFHVLRDVFLLLNVE